MVMMLTMARKTLMTMVLLWTVLDVGNPQPTGDRDTSTHTESPKVSELRHKLQRLHDILKDYETHESLPRKVPGQTGEEVTKSTIETERDNSLQDKTYKTASPVRIVSPTETIKTQQKARAVSAEDMHHKSDTDEEDLVQLAKPKTKRQGEDSIQILAKALAQIKINRPKFDEKTQSVKKTDADVPKAEMRKGSLGEDNLETSLMEELTRLLDEEEPRSQEKETTMPLFHGFQESTDNRKTVSPSNLEKVYDALRGALLSSKADNDDTNKGANNHQAIKDNDNNYNSDDDDDDLVKYLGNAGYSLDDLKTGAPVSRAQVIEDLEERLMEDIELANAVGVSVNDLIQDLEDKAFREALIRRLRRILDSR